MLRRIHGTVRLPRGRLGREHHRRAPPWAAVGARAGTWRLMLAALWLVAALLAPPLAAQEVLTLELRRADAQLQLEFALRVELPPAAEDALQRGVPLYFTAQAELYRPRWYWRDERVGRVARTWRLSFQPLTHSYRVSTGGLHQSFPSLSEALAAVTRLSRWRVADATQVDPEETHYLEFSWRLDTSQLPRPMQIGIGSQDGWDLVIERTLRLEP